MLADGLKDIKGPKDTVYRKLSTHEIVKDVSDKGNYKGNLKRVVLPGREDSSLNRIGVEVFNRTHVFGPLRYYIKKIEYY